MQHNLNSKFMIRDVKNLYGWLSRASNQPSSYYWAQDWDAWLNLRDKKIRKFGEDRSRDDNLLYAKIIVGFREESSMRLEGQYCIN